jgi:hypothetical protein
MGKKIYGDYSEPSTHFETDMGYMSLTNVTQLQIKTSGLTFGIPHLLFPDFSQDYYSLHLVAKQIINYYRIHLTNQMTTFYSICLLEHLVMISWDGTCRILFSFFSFPELSEGNS